MSNFIAAGVATVYVLPSVASLSSVTRLEIAAATATLTTPGSTSLEGLKQMTGFEKKGGTADASDVASTFPKQIKGLFADTTAQSVHKRDGASSTVFNALAPDTTAVILICRRGDATGRPYDAYPVMVTGRNEDQVDRSGNVVGFTVDYAITAEPYQNGTLPAT